MRRLAGRGLRRRATGGSGRSAAPHHTASAIALVGGGGRPRPGEISLAHNGVLFLDELPEFDRGVLEVLREPLESGHIVISRAARQAEFPARFQLVAAMNPCPCGHLGDPRRACRCTPERVAAYCSRISGPLLDRIDLHVEVPRVAREELAEREPASAPPPSRARVAAARRDSVAAPGPCANARARRRGACCERCRAGRRRRCSCSRSAMHRLRCRRARTTACCSVARTIADLAGSAHGARAATSPRPSRCGSSIAASAAQPISA
ncbi:MAG: ATP-binding protein [Comamonadaceae bacterium]|nr:ATP-binding protein [Comamonadaceae bacterium]